MLVLGCWRWAEHAQALVMVSNAPISTEPPLRVAAEPYMVNPFRWHAIVETPNLYQTAEINTHTGSIDSDPLRDVLYKPANTAAVEAAKQTLLGRAYLDWGSWGCGARRRTRTDSGATSGLEPPNPPPGRAWTTIEFPTCASIIRFWPHAGRSLEPAAKIRSPAGSTLWMGKRTPVK